jgi:hypothetical protein
MARLEKESDGECRADQHVEHGIAREGGEDDAHPLRLRDRLGGAHHQLQREDDEAQADRHATDLPDLRVAPRQEEDDAEER